MASIVLATCNGKWLHPSLGLRSLKANLGELAAEARLLEFDLRRSPVELAEALLAETPRILCLGIYIWNVELLTRALAIVKTVAPETFVLAGGPEITPHVLESPLASWVDCFLQGEGELRCAELCRRILDGEPPSESYLVAEPPELSSLALPYALYEDEDLRHRICYVETSRGCPHGCVYCRSSMDPTLRFFPLERILPAFSELLNRGCRHFKFVDRSFNASLPHGLAVLDFFRDRWQEGLVLHLEMLPHRFPEALRDRLRRFPRGGLHLEVGVQSFDAAVTARIGRPIDSEAAAEGLRFLRDETGAVVHADLIVGLPGERFEAFGRGFDRLQALAAAEIQVNLLKRLHGTPLTEHETRWGLAFAPHPPYEILRSDALSFDEIRRLHRFGRYWELVHNRGRFPATAARLVADGSPFRMHLELCDWLWSRFGRVHHLGVDELGRALFDWLVEGRGLGREEAAETLIADTQGRVDRRLPRWLSAVQRGRERRPNS